MHVDLPLLRTLYQRGQLEQTAEILLAACDPKHVDAAPAAEGDCRRQAWIEAMQLLGLTLHDLGRAADAADVIERVSLESPVSDEVRIALASSYAQLGRTHLAREIFLQLALSRRLPIPLMLKVAAGLEAIDAPQLAMQVCEWITEADDSVAQAYYDMGYYSARSGHPLYLTEALTRRALQLDPGNLHYKVGLISLLVQLDRDVEALAVFDSIAEIKFPEIHCVTCLERIAGMLLRCGQPKMAERCRARAAEIREQRDAAASPGETCHE
jgi:hypothetical protein